MFAGFIYLWTNKINNKKYIGSHIGTIDDGYVGSGKLFNKAIKKHGIMNFERTILEYVEDRDNVRTREQHYLDFYDVAKNEMFYNLKAKVDGGFEYINNNPELKEKSKQTNKDRWKRNPHPKGMKDKHHTEESKQKISKNTKNSFIERMLCKPIIQMDLNGNFIMRHDSITDAAKHVNGNPSNIKYTLDGKFKTAYKFTWCYENNEIITIKKSFSRTKEQKNSIRLKKLKQIEYKGDVYIGWDELKEKTKVSRYLYNKFYIKGFDPDPFINNKTYGIINNSKESHRSPAKGKHWFNNGIIENYYFECPFNWKKGRLKNSSK